MNERIRELAKQAGFYPENNWDHTNWHAAGHNPTFEKFAELIVRECAEIAYNKQYKHSSAHTRGDCAKAIKQHFGVEL